jgi:hypothetical protein
MTKRQLAKIIVKSYDFTKKSEFDRVIEWLKTILYHSTKNLDDVQYTMWYLEDKRRAIK